MSHESDRYVFKFLGSFGPGGTFGLFAEKLCQAFFNDAYDQTDPAQERVDKIDKQIRDQRAEYVDELFEEKGDIGRAIEGFNEENRKQAYVKLATLINKYRGTITRLEQSRLARERLFFKPDSVQYKKRMEAAKTCDADTLDNLMKMALHVVKAADSHDLSEQFGKAESARGAADVEFGDIEKRVSKREAEQLLAAWKKILVEYEKEGNNIDALFEGENKDDALVGGGDNATLEGLKDKLFIQTGQDQYDTFFAFDHYGLNQRLTDQDRAQI